ncbi:MAG: hypothetical protein ACYDH5_01255 [Acidimicrobiales bacterium]
MPAEVGGHVAPPVALQVRPLQRGDVDFQLAHVRLQLSVVDLQLAYVGLYPGHDLEHTTQQVQGVPGDLGQLAHLARQVAHPLRQVAHPLRQVAHPLRQGGDRLGEAEEVIG